MDETFDKTEATNQSLKCKNCGGVLKFAPGTHALNCPYCGEFNEIAIDTKAEIVEMDYLQFLEKGFEKEEKQTISVVACTSCGSKTTLKPNITSDDCPFCGTSLVIESGSQASILKPKSLLPFKIDQKQGMDLFKKWIDDLWFAPNDLKSRVENREKLKGMYIPYWTFDSDTYSEFWGQRGDNYTITETYTDSEGKSQTRSVTKIRWTSVAGNHDRFFDDVVVNASHSLPKDYADQLEPWDTKNLVPYNDQFLSGFQTETYQVGLKEGFEDAKGKMKDMIEADVKQKIGGDHQQIERLNTKYSQITFKHILLPIWISAFLYNQKVYRFLINGRTGEVQGERPYSWIKIGLLVLLVAAIIAAVVYFNR